MANSTRQIAGGQRLSFTCPKVHVHAHVHVHVPGPGQPGWIGRYRHVCVRPTEYSCSHDPKPCTTAPEVKGCLCVFENVHGLVNTPANSSCAPSHHAKRLLADCAPRCCSGRNMNSIVSSPQHGLFTWSGSRSLGSWCSVALPCTLARGVDYWLVP